MAYAGGMRVRSRFSGEPLRPLARPAIAVSGLVLACCLATLGGCAPNPVFPECGGSRLLLANLATMGFYGLSCADKAASYRADERIKAIRDADIERCVEQGGDPAACRAAVYAPREPTQIIVRPRVVQPVQNPSVVLPGVTNPAMIQRGAVPGTYYIPGPTGPRWFTVTPLPQ
jgi:hypothetical protein